MTSKVLQGVVGGLLSVGLVLAACVPQQAPSPTVPVKPAVKQPQRGGSLRVGVLFDANSFDPHHRTGITRAIFSFYDNLVTLDEKFNVLPALATSWEVAANGKVVVFKLRQGVKFHDGTDFNAEAVKFNVQRILDPETKARFSTDFKAIDTIEAVDPYTVRINLKLPDASILAAFADVGGLIASPAAIKKYGQDWPRNPVGTGPFRLAEWVKDDHLTVKRNEDYWDKNAASLDEVVFKPIPDENVRLVNLKARSIDFIDVPPAKDVPALKSSDDLKYVEAPSLGYIYMWMNHAKPPFDKKPLRQALAYAIDQKAIIEGVERGLADIAKGPISTASWAYDESLPARPLDLDKARSLLKEGGMPEGYRFEAQVANPAIFQQRAQAMQSQLAKVGIKMDIQLLDVGALLSKQVAREFVASMIWLESYLTPDRYLGQVFSQSAENYAGWSNKRYDELFTQQKEAYDQSKRKVLITEMQRIIMDELPLYYLVYPKINAAMAKNVQGYVESPASHLKFGTTWLEK